MTDAAGAGAVRGLARLPALPLSSSMRWYFQARAAGEATAEEVEANFGPDFRWGWGSPREAGPLDSWFQRWRGVGTTIEDCTRVDEFSFLVTTRLDGGLTARVGFVIEPHPPHRILDTTTGTLEAPTGPADLAVQTEVAAAADGTYRARFHPGFTTPMGPFGGYVAAVALRAAGAHCDKPRPLSMACHFLAVGHPGPVEVAATTGRASSRLESVHVRLSQGGTPIMDALIWASVDQPGVATGERGPQPGRVPSVGELRAATGDAATEERWEVVELVRVPEDPPAEEAPGPGPVQAWVRMRPEAVTGDPWVDASARLLPFDLLAVEAAARPTRSDGLIVPTTLDLSIAFYNHDRATEWALFRAESSVSAGGITTAAVSAWTEGGAPLATGMLQALQRGASRPG